MARFLHNTYNRSHGIENVGQMVSIGMDYGNLHHLSVDTITKCKYAYIQMKSEGLSAYDIEITWP